MANFNSILQEDTTNVNMSGSNVKPYALSEEDIAKDTPANLDTANSEETLAAPIQQELPLENIKITPSEQEMQAQRKEQELKQEQQNITEEAKQVLQEQVPPLTWDTADNDQKMTLYSAKGGMTDFDFYVPEINKVIRTNTDDSKELNKLIAISMAKTKEEKDAIYSATYFDNKNAIYLGPRNSPITTALKGVGSMAADSVQGAVQAVMSNYAVARIKSLETLFEQLTSTSLDAETKSILLDTPTITFGNRFSSLSPAQKQEFLQLAYKQYIKNTEKELETVCKFTPNNDKLQNIEMFKKYIDDPLETLQGADTNEEAKKKFNEWLSKPETKQYISPKLLENQKALEEAFKSNYFFAKLENDSKIELTQIKELFNGYKEMLHLNYVPELDSPYAYQAGQLGFSYAGQLVALATGHFELAGIFAASQFGETLNKAIDSGLPLDVSTEAANFTALFQYVTEKLQLSLFRANFSSLSNYISVGLLNTVAENALQEGVQDFGTKAIEQFYGVDSFTVEDYVLDFCINAGIGALMSVPMGAIVHYQKARYVNNFMQANPDMSKKQAMELADMVITKGTEALSTPEGKQKFYEGIKNMTANIAEKSIKSKSSEDVDVKAQENMIKAAYEALIQPVSPEQKQKFAKDFKDATEYSVKYLTEQVGMFESEAKALVGGLNNLYKSLSMITGMSQRQIAENMLPSVVNMMSLAALNNYKNVDNKNSFIKYEAMILKSTFKNLGPIGHLTDADFLSMAQDVINGIPINEVAEKYKVLYNEEEYNLIRNNLLMQNINLESLSAMLENSDIATSDLKKILEVLKTLPTDSEEYDTTLNVFYNELNNVMKNANAGALFGNNKGITNPVEAFSTLFINKPVMGVDVHEYGHFFDIVFYANQMCAKLGLPTTSFNIKIMNLYNALGRKITGKSDFVYNPYNYTDPDQIKVAEALPNIMAEYLIEGKEYDKDSAELIKYISSLYKYINSTFIVTSEYADTKEAKELVKEIQKAEKEDGLSVAVERLLKLADTGDFNNQDIYNIVKGLRLNEALKLAIYIEKGQHPVVTLIQAINDINNTRVDSMYRKAIKFNQDVEIKTKYLTIPEGLSDNEKISDDIKAAKELWEKSDKSLKAERKIFKETGVYKDEKSNWGKIVSDENARIDKNKLKSIRDEIGEIPSPESFLAQMNAQYNKHDIYLKDILQYDNISKIYPNYNNIKIDIKNLQIGVNGIAPDNDYKKIILSVQLFREGKEQTLKEKILHELQHVIDRNANIVSKDFSSFGKFRQLLSKHPEFGDIDGLVSEGARLYTKKFLKGFELSKKEQNLYNDIVEAMEEYVNSFIELRAIQSERDSEKSYEELINEDLPTKRRTYKQTFYNTNTQEIKDKLLKEYGKQIDNEEEFNKFISSIIDKVKSIKNAPKKAIGKIQSLFSKKNDNKITDNPISKVASETVKQKTKEERIKDFLKKHKNFRDIKNEKQMLEKLDSLSKIEAEMLQAGKYLPKEQKQLQKELAFALEEDNVKEAKTPEQIIKEYDENNKEDVSEKDNSNKDNKEEQELQFTVSEIMGDNFSKTFAVVSEVLRKDSPKMFAHARQAMFRAKQDVVRYKQQAKNLVIAVNKMSDNDKYTWEKSWNNRDFTAMVELADKYDFRDELVAIRATLNELHQVVCSAFEGESYTQLLSYLTDYFPRLVIDHDGLASYITAKGSDKSTTDTDTPETSNNKFEKWMDKVKQLLEDDINYKKEKIGSPDFYKQRKIKFVDDEMLKFYAKSTDAFDNYINKVQDILFRKYFFGNGYVKEFMNSEDDGKHLNINGIDYVIPNWKQRVEEMGFLTGDEKTDARILGAIESVFFRGDTGSFGAIYRTATNVLTINSFFSALSNLGDLALTLYNYGFKKTMKAVKDVALKDAPLTSEDLGIVDLYEEFKADGTKLKKVFNAVMKWSGFQYLDKFTKEVNVQAALLDAKKALESSGEKTEQVIDRIYMYMGGDEEAANALIANIINNNWKDQDVKLFAFNELSNQQPITKLEVPEFYNKYPQFRVLYLYKTFAVKQLNFAYANILSEIKTNPKQGIKKLVRFMAWLLAVGVTKDVIADMLKGKEIHLTDSAMFSISSFFFLNEYNYYTFKNKGAIMGMFHMVMPPVPLMTEISSDVKRASKGKIDNPFQLKTIRGVPVIGKPFQYWFGD